MTKKIEERAAALQSSKRRGVLRAGAALAGGAALGTLGFPGFAFADQAKVRIGHLTPLTGFLGSLGEYAVMGISLALEEVNRAGGVMGRQVELVSEDSVNPSVASSKAQRLIERDHVVALVGEINSASALTISQVAARHQRLFMSTGARSDALRGKNCSKYSFYVDTSNTSNVKAVGRALLAENLVKGKKLFTLTADYVFGHDLLHAAKNFISANNGILIGDEMVATDVTDFSPYLIKIRQSKPDVVCSNLAGNQVTTFLKQYAEFGLSYPIAGFNLNTADAWAAGADNFGGIWPTVWDQDVDTPSSKAFVAAFEKKYGKPPENHAWVEYVALKIMVQAMNATKSTDTDKLIAYFEKGAQFDVLKARKGWFRSWDHQLMQEMYSLTLKPKGSYKQKWDFLALGPAVPGPSESLEAIATTRQENDCKL
ncbi:MAG TPA: ABC transporter substrate-binding protein [Rhodocyclaceae bacterium]|nr:ABC transporter substrate-binding protein [Rhodocyclaceae bacterium]